MARVVERAFEVARATFPRAPRNRLAHPFGFDEHPPYRWRLSRDVWDELRQYAGEHGQAVPKDPDRGDMLLGEPVTVDDELPPNSMLLEPMLATIVARPDSPRGGQA